MPKSVQFVVDAVFYQESREVSQTHVMIVNLFVLASEAGVGIRAGFGPCLRLTRARWTQSPPTAANTVYASMPLRFCEPKAIVVQPSRNNEKK
jgi:hypothetical protein